MMNKENKKQHNKNFGKGSWKSFFHLIGKIGIPWWLLAIMIVFNTVYSEFMALIPQKTTELFSGEFNNALLLEYIGFQGLYCVAMLFVFLSTPYAKAEFIKRARTKAWNKMLLLDMNFYGKNSPNFLVSAVTEDISAVTGTMYSLMVALIPDVYYMVRVFTTIGEYDWLLLLSIVVLMPLTFVYTIIFGRWRYEVNAKIYATIGGLTGFLVERIQNLFLIKAYTNEKKELANGHNVSKQLHDAYMKQVKVAAVSGGLNTVLDVVQRLVIVVFGVWCVRQGRITMPQWVAFFLYSQTLLNLASTWSGKWMELKTAQGAAARVCEVFNAPNEKTDEGSKEMPVGDICFNNVTFSYEDEPVLDNFSAVFAKGSSTAIVGLCGSGKTTILNLIERFYTPQEGTLTIGGVPTQSINVISYRNHISYVQQDAGVFSGTIREALTYGTNKEYTDEELLQAVKKAGALNFVKSRPRGLDEELTISGTSLSGGQRQRIVLAREFLKDTDILLLDEPTSALDAGTAKEVQNTIFSLFKDKTLILVSHDLSLVSQADNALVLDDGKIVAQGNHSQLLDKSPLYSELVSAQKVEGGSLA